MRPKTLKTIRLFRLKMPICSTCFNKAISGISPDSQENLAFMVMQETESLIQGLKRRIGGRNLEAARVELTRLNVLCEQFDAVWLSIQQRMDFIAQAPGSTKRHARAVISTEVRRMNAARHGLCAARRILSKVIETDYDEARRAAKAFISKEWVRQTIFHRHGWKCATCPEVNGITIDHIVPVIRGGQNTLENLQPLCRSCNARKASSLVRTK